MSGLNFEFMAKHVPDYIAAAGLTAYIALWGIVFSLIVGFLCAVVQYYKIPVLKRIVSCYVELSRNTPLLIQLYFIYFGLPKIGIKWSAEVCAIVGLIFLGGSYMAETFRSGFDSVEPIQLESAMSLGFGKMLMMREIILPQALAVSVPGLCANIIFLIKETSVVSAIALADLMFVTKDLIGTVYETDEALIMLVISYLVILLPISVVSTLLERRLRRAGFGN